MEIKSAFCNSFLADSHGFVVKQNIKLCPGHQYALTFDLGELECVNGDAAWKAMAAGQQLGSSQPGLTTPDSGNGIGTLYLNALPPGSKGSGTPAALMKIAISMTQQVCKYTHNSSSCSHA